MHRSAVKLVAASIVVLWSPLSAEAVIQPQFDVTIVADAPMHVDVRAVLPAGLDTVRFSGPSVGIDPHEWIPRLSMAAGATLVDAETGEWSFAEDDGETRTLAYSVDLTFATRDWPAGNEHSAYYADEILYLVGETIFPEWDGFEKLSISVAFHLPEGWRASTPWQPVVGLDNVYSVTGNQSLRDNAIVIGRHDEFSRDADGFSYTFVPVSSTSSTPGIFDVMEPVAGKILEGVIGLFGGAPDGRYLQAMILSDEEDGEAFSQSSGFRTSLTPTPENSVLWANQMAHELIHKWLARDGAIHPVDADRLQWLTEGVSEYFANVILVRLGVLTPGDFIAKMEKNIGLYLYYGWSPAFEATLSEAGADKFLNRLAVYNGGWTAAFCLDSFIRNGSETRYGLEDAMVALYERHGETGKAFVVADVATAIHGATGVDVADYIVRYTEEQNLMPIEICLADFGFKAGVKGYAGEIYIWPDEEAPLAAETARGLLLGSRH